MTIIGQPLSAAPSRNRTGITRKQCWMLLLAFEVLVFGLAQSVFQPVRRPGIIIEMSVTPNHRVT